MKQLGSTDAVEDLEAETLLPPVIKLGRQRLAGRKADADRREFVSCVGVRLGSILFVLLFQIFEHLAVKRRDAEEDGGTEALDETKDIFGLGGFGIKNDGSADAKGQIAGVAEAVGEEEAGGGERRCRSR